MLKQFVREQGNLELGWTACNGGNFKVKRGRPIGVLVAERVGDEVRIGWSKLNESNRLQVKDRWNKEVGTEVAIARMNGVLPTPEIIPYPILNAMEEFNERCSRYFKIEV